MGMELLALILILLARAQRQLSPTPAADAAADAAKKASDAAAAAAAAAAAGDHATAKEKSTEANAHATTAKAIAKSARTPPPWPMALPPDLPAFPGGWTPASPVSSAMVSRAFQLLPQLWNFGAGTWKPEKTGPSWVVYQARQMGDKRGVVAFTPLAGAMPTAQPEVTPGEVLPTMTVRAGPTVPASTAVPASRFPTLRLTQPRTSGPSVVWLQQHLGIGADGVFGPNTQARVMAFQQSHGLTADGVVGPRTWAALGTAQAA